MSNVNEDIDVYITKYALTTGISHVLARVVKDTNGQMIEVKMGLHIVYFHGEGKDWHRTEEGAVKRAEELRVKKIASLKKQIKKLESLKFWGE